MKPEKTESLRNCSTRKGADENHLHIPKNVRDVAGKHYANQQIRFLHFAKPVISAKIV